MAISYEEDMKRKQREAEQAQKFGNYPTIGGGYQKNHDGVTSQQQDLQKFIDRTVNAPRPDIYAKPSIQGNAPRLEPLPSQNSANDILQPKNTLLNLNQQQAAPPINRNGMNTAFDATSIIPKVGLGFDANALKTKPTSAPQGNVTTVDNPLNVPAQAKPQVTSWADDPEMQKIFANPQSTSQPTKPITYQEMVQLANNPLYNDASPQAATQGGQRGYSSKQIGTINGKPVTQVTTQDIAPKPMYDTAQERALQQTYSEVNAPNTRMPVREARDYLADIERKNLIRMLSTPVGGAKGLVTGQIQALKELALQGDNIDAAAYKEQMAYGQANMAQQNQNARTSLEQQNAMTKSLLDETGQNSRSQAQLGLDVSKLNQLSQQEQAKFGLDRDQLALERDKFNQQNYAQNQLNQLHEAYANATTDAEREAIQKRAQTLTAFMGTNNNNSKDRYVTIKGGEAADKDGNPIAQPDRIFDTQTRQYVGDAQTQSQSGTNTVAKDPMSVLNDTSKSVSQRTSELKQMGYTEEQIKQFIGSMK